MSGNKSLAISLASLSFFKKWVGKNNYKCIKVYFSSLKQLISNVSQTFKILYCMINFDYIRIYWAQCTRYFTI